MKLRYILLFFLLLSACQKEGPVSPVNHYIKFYGSYLEDNGYDMQPTSDGGYVIIGSSNRQDTGRDIVLIRVDKYGNQVSWSPKYFGGNGDDAGFSVKVLDDGGFIIAGYVTDMQAKANKNAVLIRTDSQGELVWQHEFGGDADDEAKSVVVKQGGGFILAGYTENRQQMKQIYLLNVDQDGNMVSSTTRPVTGEELSSIIELSDGNFLVAGTKYITTHIGSLLETQILVLVLNQVGNDLDNYSFGESGVNEMVANTFPSSDGTFFLVGTLASLDGSQKSILIKKLARRKIIWEKTIKASSGSLEGKAICETEDGSLILVADKTVSATKNIELYFLNSQGDLQNTREFGASGEQTAEALSYLNGNIVILGKNTQDIRSMITLIKTDRKGDLWN